MVPTVRVPGPSLRAAAGAVAHHGAAPTETYVVTDTLRLTCHLPVEVDAPPVVRAARAGVLAWPVAIAQPHRVRGLVERPGGPLPATDRPSGGPDTRRAGRADEHRPAQDLLAEAPDLLPHGTRVTIAAGHHVHDAEPEAFTDAVRSWLMRASMP